MMPAFGAGSDLTTLIIAIVAPAFAGFVFCALWIALYHRVFNRAPAFHILLLGFVAMAWFWLPACLVVLAAIAPHDGAWDRLSIAGAPCVIGAALVASATRSVRPTSAGLLAGALVVLGYVSDVPAGLLVMTGPVMWMGAVLLGALLDPTRTAALPRSTRCKACGYDVRGLPYPICPECGEAISPASSPRP
jgi:hypothetical protein